MKFKHPVHETVPFAPSIISATYLSQRMPKEKRFRMVIYAAGASCLCRGAPLQRTKSYGSCASELGLQRSNSPLLLCSAMRLGGPVGRRSRLSGRKVKYEIIASWKCSG